MNETKTEGLELKLDTAIYPLEAIQSACYHFTDRAYVRIASSGEAGASVELKLKDASADGIQALSGEFHNELLHQALRLKVSQANQKIREFIVTKALVSAQPAEAAAAAEDCAECRRPPQEGAAPAAGAPVDPELEAEIEKLLAEIEKSDEKADPLKVAVPWEEAHAKEPGAKPEKSAPAAKKKRAKKGAA